MDEQRLRGSAQWSVDAHLQGAVLLALLLVTFVAYAPVLRHAFVEWDDPYYVTENAHVRLGLTAHTIGWAFTSIELGNWIPLARLSHLLDVSLFGLAPSGHHLTSLLLHLANTLMLFVALRRLTRAAWKSLAVAALFALHPLHVESVAWVAERKDVLSTFFWFAALWAHARYAERPGPLRHALVALVFALGLMAKSMLVSLPLTLLIVDAWPLQRVGRGGLIARWRPLVIEKLPLFAMSLAAAFTAWLAQRSYGAVTDSPLAVRLANVVLGYTGYLAKTVWPVGLSAFYPYQLHPPVLDVAASAALLVAISIAVAWLGRRRPYPVAGWLWYLVTLLPVIGLVRFGQQSMADRFSYVPLVGVFVMVVWGTADLAARARVPAVARWATVPLFAFLAFGARRQVDTWQNGVTLWERVLAHGGNSTVSQNNLGVSLEKAGRLDEAATHYAEAVRLEPRNARASTNLAFIRFEQGRWSEAIASYEDALRVDSSDAVTRRSLAMTHYDYGNAQWRAGRLDDAIHEYRAANRWRPDDAGVLRALGLALVQQSRPDEAAAALQRSLELDPANVVTHEACAVASFQTGNYAAAWREVAACRALGGKPDPRLIAELSRKMPEPR